MACGQNSQRPVPARIEPVSAGVESAKVSGVPAVEAPTSGSTDRGLWFSVGSDTILVLKVADVDHPPREGFDRGGDEFRRVLAEGRVDRPLLLHLVMSDRLAGAGFRHRSGGSIQPLPGPSMIFRMPNSPRYTFAVVRSGSPGILEAVLADGRLGTIDLVRWSRELAGLPLQRDPESGFVSYGRLPKSLYGKMPP